MYEMTIPVARGVTVKVTGEDHSELFKAAAEAQEIYSEERCGLCGSEAIRMAVRKNKDEELFYEYQCQGLVKTEKGTERCRAYLALGQNKKGGGLFPIRALTEAGKPDRAEGAFGRHNGWTRYRGEPKPEPAKPAPRR